MADVLVKLSPDAVLEAIEANKRELIRSFRLFPQAEVHDGPDLLWTITSLPYALFNAALCARLGPGEADGAIEEAVARGQSRGVPLIWWVGPRDTPADLGQRLVDHRFAHGGDAAVMALDLLEATAGPHRPPDFRLEQAADAASIRSCARIAAEVFRHPPEILAPWQDYYEQASEELAGSLFTFIGLKGGEPIATSVLFLAAGVAGVYNVATLPKARRQGVGTAVILAACAKARDLGYRTAVLEASEMGQGIYQRMGFRRYGTTAIYVWEA